MPCYRPITGIFKGQYNENGKKVFELCGSMPIHEVQVLWPGSVSIPCGRCIGCRLDYSRQWADRMMLELDVCKKGLFVTLTYDNDHIPVSMYDDDDLPVAYTLDKRDCQLWMKRLRKKFGKGIRFYLAGEYGSTTYRPHYHAILFGIGLDDLPDLVRHGRNELGQDYYISSMLSETWSLGFVLVSDVSWQTCAYVARYVTKKLYGPDAFLHSYLNSTPPFALMSRKPGIGKPYLDAHPDCLDYENISLSTPEGGKKLRIPRYYLKQLQLTNSEKYDSIKSSRMAFARDKLFLELQRTDLSYIEYLEAQENAKLNQIRSLSRK